MKPRHTSPSPQHRAPRRLQLRPLALSLICAGAAPAMAQVLPTGFTPVGGTVSMTRSGGVMDITQGTARGIVNWTSFSIGSGGVVNIVQPSASSVLLNRVTGNQLSTIAGQLNANGRVVLVNPNGVMFSQGASVNVGGLIASTLAMTTSDKSFMDGATSLAFERDDSSTAAVRNRGSLTATGGGPVVLMGASVSNASTGRITADGGAVALASGRKITLDLAGDGLTNLVIAPDSMATHASVVNRGALQADGGRVSLIGSSTTVGELVVNQSGTVRARTLGMQNGEIVLGGGQDNRVEMTGGTLDATGTGAGQRGGSISVMAGQVQLQGAGAGQAVLDASGQAGGGTVTVRGYDVALASGSVLRADATGAGPGGSIDVGSASGYALPGDTGAALEARTSNLQAFGEMTARGAGSGAGGTIATSGDFVRINPTLVDAGGGAQGGANGSWTVSTGANLGVASAADIPAYDGTYPRLFQSSVSAEGVGGALGRNTDVTLTSTNTGDNAGVVFGANTQVVKAEGGSATLRVNSAGSIVMNDGAVIDARSGALNVDFNADSTGVVAANAARIATHDGNPNFDTDYAGAISLTGASINANGGDIRFFGQGDAANGRAVGGSVSHSDDAWRDGISLDNSTLSTGGAGQISLRGEGRSWVDSQDSSSNFLYVGSNGVSVQGGAVQAGSGGLQLDGLAGFGASGVSVGSGAMLQATGNIALTGLGATWTSDQPAASVNASTAVVIDGATVASDRNVSIAGTGADLDGLRSSDVFAGTNRAAGGGGGVSIYGSVTAGAGQRIDVTGVAGSDGFSATTGDLRAIVITPSTVPTYGVSVSADAQQPDPLQTAGGTIAIDGQGSDVALRMNTYGSGLSGVSDGGMLSVASDSGQGGTISVAGRNVLIDGARNFDGSQLIAGLDASGATGGGSIRIAATNAIALGSNAALQADARGATGNGGSVELVAGNALRAYGSLSARGGASGGDGGMIETSAPQFDLTGLRVAASAPAGRAGQWLIDPYDVTISHGAAASSLTGNPFDPIAASVLQDGDINNALNAGTSVTITTGTTGPATGGNIMLDTGVQIDRTAGAAPVTFRLDANASIFNVDASTVIQSDSSKAGVGALNVEFNAGLGANGGSVNYSGTINTNGGNVSMTANTVNGNPAIGLFGATIDTRTAALDAGPGGNVTITGRSSANSAFVTSPTVSLASSTVQTATGNVSITGIGPIGDGVSIVASGRLPGGVFTTSGSIDIVGVGSAGYSSATPLAGSGVLINGATVRSVDGDIRVAGLVLGGTNDVNGSGVRIADGGLVTSLGNGDIEVTGESQANGAGVTIAAAGTGVAGRIDGNRNVLLRAANDGTADALVVGGTVRAANVLDLRPGGVDAAGHAGDRTGNAITLGGTAATGFAVSADEFTRLSAATIVAGSNAHAADITVAGPLTLASALTLQNGGGGNIQLDGAIGTPQLGLLSAGNIGQAGGAGITAGTLLARSSGGNAVLDSAANNVGTVGGGAAGRFVYVNAGALTVGPVSVTGFDAAGNLPQGVSATSMAADTVLVRTLAGDLTLAAPVSSSSGVDLVAAARFQNTGAGRIDGASWRVWADTWVGETRGGLAGSGLLPNLYHCAYFGLCTVNVPATDNHFIYAQQPTATVTIGNASRAGGLPNPPFTYSITGLILGDTGAGFGGVLGTLALRGSPPGLYAINGSFTSAEGYAIRVVPGELRVGAFPSLPSVDVVRDMPTTWLYDRNIGQAPICLATGPLDGDRAQQGADVLAREWSRVRSRPNLTSCVDTQRRNGCSDF